MNTAQKLQDKLWKYDKLSSFLDSYTLSTELCERCGHFSNYLSQYEKLTDEDIEFGWSRIFSAVYVHLGGSYKDSKFLFDNLFDTGNWSHLQMNEAEKSRDMQQFVDDFRYDVFYCSDRWSLDRLARCH